MNMIVVVTDPIRAPQLLEIRESDVERLALVLLQFHELEL
jgi:hypothetical protein